jgi:hypothetical protein
VLYFAGYKRIRDRYKVEEIERAADVIVWCCDEAPGFTPTRAAGPRFVGNIVQAMAAYGSGSLASRRCRCATRPHMIVIGSDRHDARRWRERGTACLAAVAEAPTIRRSRRSTRRCNA